MRPSSETLVLDFDRSVNLPENTCHRLDLQRYEDQVRYSASMSAMRRLEHRIMAEINCHRLYLLGSGDFHHVSYLLIKNMPHDNVHVVVFDTHPDNMFFPAGIHCGSWVYHASRLPNVSAISVFGIASGDITGLNVLQNRLSVIRSGKVQYFCLSPVGAFLKRAGNRHIKEIGSDYPSTIHALREEISKYNSPIYLSIDKDVLSADSIRTTWDQGKMPENELMRCIKALSKKVVAADITGDISVPVYHNPMKKILRWIDGESSNPLFTTDDFYKHQTMNLKILSLLARNKE